MEYVAEHLHENIQVEEENFMLKGYLKTEEELLNNKIGVDNVNMGNNRVKVG